MNAFIREFGAKNKRALQPESGAQRPARKTRERKSGGVWGCVHVQLSFHIYPRTNARTTLFLSQCAAGSLKDQQQQQLPFLLRRASQQTTQRENVADDTKRARRVGGKGEKRGNERKLAGRKGGEERSSIRDSAASLRKPAENVPTDPR